MTTFMANVIDPLKNTHQDNINIYKMLQDAIEKVTW